MTYEPIDANQLLKDSYLLAKKILDSDFKPNFIVGIWRGGTPVGIAVQELLSYKGIKTDHIAIRTSAYDSGIDNMKREIKVYGLDYIIEQANSEDNLLLVDDVFDTGLSMQAVLEAIKAKSRKNTPNIKIATVYFKPSRNKTKIIPDYYIHETDNWLIFPHELDGLNLEEIKELKGEEIYNIIK